MWLSPFLQHHLVLEDTKGAHYGVGHAGQAGNFKPAFSTGQAGHLASALSVGHAELGHADSSTENGNFANPLFKAETVIAIANNTAEKIAFFIIKKIKLVLKIPYKGLIIMRDYNRCNQIGYEVHTYGYSSRGHRDRPLFVCR